MSDLVDLDTMSFQGLTTFGGLISLHTIQTIIPSQPKQRIVPECVCAQVMEANREEAFLSTHPQPLSALSPHKQCPTNREAVRPNPETLQILFPAGFDLIVLLCDLRLNHSCEHIPETDEWLFSETSCASFHV